MKIIFDFQSAFISRFRMRTLTQKNEISIYDIEMKLTHLVISNNYLVISNNISYVYRHLTVFLQNPPSNAIAHGKNAMISKVGIR